MSREYSCPRDGCDGDLEYGAVVDARKYIVGYGCTECPYAFTTWNLKQRGVIEEDT